MANGITTAFWSVTINNYDEKDLALIQNGYPDYCREIVWTLEEGQKEQTPHIQAWVKLQRQQRMSFLRKLFPGAHYKPCTSDEYIHHTKTYAQKKDETTRSASVHKFNDPMHTIESVMKRVIIEMEKDLSYEIYDNSLLPAYRHMIEKRLVEKDYKLAKIFVSSTYKAMWKHFGPAMYSCVVAEHTHTHTHNDEKFSQQVDIPTEDGSICGQSTEESSDGVEGEDGEDYEEGESEADEGSTEGSDADSGEEDDF